MVDFRHADNPEPFTKIRLAETGNAQPDVAKLRADLAAAQREVAVTERNLCDAMNALHKSEREIAAWRQSVDELLTGKFASEIKHRVRELLAQEGVPAQPQYREPTLEDVIELRNCNLWGAPKWLDALKQLGFVRKVQP